MATTQRVVIKTPTDARKYLVSIQQDFKDIDGDDEHVMSEQFCPRCHGSGSYSFCPGYGSACFRCVVQGFPRRWMEKFNVVNWARHLRKKETARLAAQRRQRKRSDAKLEHQRDWCEKKGHGRLTFAELDQKKSDERAAKRAEKAALSDWVGSVGERVTVSAKLVFTTEVFGQFGSSTLYKFETADNDQISWFTTSYIDVDQGSPITLTGRVKKHDEYQGAKQTIMTRCKVEVTGDES